MKLRLLIYLFLTACAAVGVLARNGSTAYNFLNVTSSAKIYGLGGINISLVDDDISTVDQNPALLGCRDEQYAGDELHALYRWLKLRWCKVCAQSRANEVAGRLRYSISDTAL